MTQAKDALVERGFALCKIEIRQTAFFAHALPDNEEVRNKVSGCSAEEKTLCQDTLVWLEGFRNHTSCTSCKGTD